VVERQVIGRDNLSAAPSSASRISMNVIRSGIGMRSAPHAGILAKHNDPLIFRVEWQQLGAVRERDHWSGERVDDSKFVVGVGVVSGEIRNDDPRIE